MKPPGKVYLIDSNVILRYLLDDHKRLSPKAKKIMEDVSEAAVHAEIRDIVIVECIYVLEKFYKVPRIDIADKLGAILNFKGIANPDKHQILKGLMCYPERVNVLQRNLGGYRRLCPCRPYLASTPSHLI
jgi:predicted nucleic-acid-binding protein